MITKKKKKWSNQTSFSSLKKMNLAFFFFNTNSTSYSDLALIICQFSFKVNTNKNKETENIIQYTDFKKECYKVIKSVIKIPKQYPIPLIIFFNRIFVNRNDSSIFY